MYFYTGGRLDSLIDFGVFPPNAFLTKSRSARIENDSEGRPVRITDFQFEESDVASDSLFTTFAYPRLDSIEVRSASGPDAETRFSGFRLTGGNPVAMTETVTEAGKSHTFHHAWTYGETAGIRPRAAGTVTGRVRKGDGAGLRWNRGGWRRTDGRAAP